MSKLIFLLILFVFVLILSATPLFRKSRSQREYESSGMQLLATSRGRVLLYRHIFYGAYVSGHRF